MTKVYKKIGLFVPTYLNRSETFIYNIVSGLKKYKTVVFSNKKQNLKHFPAEEIYSYQDLSLKEKLTDRWIRKYGTTISHLKKTGILLVHAQFGSVGVDLIKLKELWPALPLITHFRGQDAYQFSNNFFYKMKLKKLFRVGDLFLTVSEHMRDHLIENLDCPERKIIVHYGGIHIKKIPFKIRNMKGGRKQIKILMCGRLTEKKGFDYGIKAFFELLAKGYDLKMNIIGTGPLENSLKKLVEKLRIENTISFLGGLSQDAVLKKMRDSDILLAPYVVSHNGDSEGIPNILKEALASGLPVVSTKHTGVPEIIIDGSTGLLVNEKAIIMLSRKVEELINDQELVKKLALNGRAHVEHFFDIHKQNEKLEAIYQKLIN